ncbi:MAG: diaminopimelate epimerase [Halanaerobiales bacterium]|nr:diaminopimelate epimerase [Halanaerobiales bacterium]
MKLNFTKMHGTGNDFIVIDGFRYKIKNYRQLAIDLCKRHFGIGGDGLIIILPPESKENDFRMRIFNADGSEAEMCGNGIRCFSHYLREKNLTGKDILRVETLAGIITPEVISGNRKTSQIRVNMGKPKFKPAEIPVDLDTDAEYIQEHKLPVNDKTFQINCVSMGNPHTIIFREDIDQIPLAEWGKEIENHPAFPEKTNVEFIRIIDRSEIAMRVWERGSGITLACGTGASASVVAGIKNNYLDEKVVVHLPGGDLVIEWSGDDVFMTGPAETVFNGAIEIEEGLV